MNIKVGILEYTKTEKSDEANRERVRTCSICARIELIARSNSSFDSFSSMAAAFSCSTGTRPLRSEDLRNRSMRNRQRNMRNRGVQTVNLVFTLGSAASHSLQRVRNPLRVAFDLRILHFLFLLVILFIRLWPPEN